MKLKNFDSIELVPYKGKFKVKLLLDGSSRTIGICDNSEIGFFSTRRTRVHLFRKTNSLGINHRLLTSTKIKFKWILIDYEGEKLITTRQYFLAKGNALKFGQQGFELQVFLPLSEFGKEKAEQFEKEHLEQDLFQEVGK